MISQSKVVTMETYHKVMFVPSAVTPSWRFLFKNRWSCQLPYELNIKETDGYGWALAKSLFQVHLAGIFMQNCLLIHLLFS